MTRGPAEMEGSASVAIISDAPDFAGMLMDRWQNEACFPSFTLLGGDLGEGICSLSWDLVVIGPVREEKLARVLQAAQTCKAALYVESAPSQLSRGQYPRLTVVRRDEGWVETAVTLCCEMLRRMEAREQLLQIERTLAQNEQYAILGRYMLDMRHNVNNALTSLLGNAELLLLEPGALSAQNREQVRTIHNMALRMHEIMQRFTSLESEMRFVADVPRREASRVTPPALMMKSSA